MDRLPKLKKSLKDRISAHDRLSDGTLKTIASAVLVASLSFGVASDASAKAAEIAKGPAAAPVSDAAKAVVLEPAARSSIQHAYHQSHRSHYSHQSHRSHYSHYSSRY